MPRKKELAEGGTLPKGVYEHPPGSGVYWIQYFDQNGRRCREKAGSLSKAKSLVSQRRADIKKAKLFPAPPTKKSATLFDVMNRYMQDSRARKSSWKDDLRYSKYWDSALGQMPVADITPSHVKDERRRLLATPYERRNKKGEVTVRKKRTVATVNRYVAFLKAVLYSAMDDDLVERNACKFKGGLQKENNLRERFLTPEEEGRLQTSVPSRLWHYVLLAIETGLRQEEQICLRWEHVDFANGILTIPRSKHGEKRHVPISATAMEVLQARPSRLKSPWVYPRANDMEHHLSFGAIRPDWEKAVNAAGLGDFHWHDLRHTFASRAVMAGVDLMTVANWLGHKSLAMMTRYAHLAPDHHKSALAKVAEKFRGATPLPPGVSSIHRNA